MDEQSFFESELFYRLCADGIVIVHFGIVLFILFGLLLTIIGIFRKWNWVRNVLFRGIHLLGILFIVGQTLVGQTCPLTIWEKNLRTLAGQETYEGDFIANCVHDALFYTGPPWVFNLCYSMFGLAVLLTFIFAPPRFKRSVPEQTPAEQPEQSASEQAVADAPQD